MTQPVIAEYSYYPVFEVYATCVITAKMKSIDQNFIYFPVSKYQYVSRYQHFHSTFNRLKANIND